MDADTVIQALSLIATVITAGAASYLAYSALLFTARPQLVLTVEPENRTFLPEAEVTLQLWLHNIGHWYAKPAATEMLAYVNVDEACEPLRVRLGLNFEDDDYHTTKTALTGKGRANGRSRYLLVRGINVINRENGEVIELTIRTPTEPGLYEGWLVLLAKEGDCGLHTFNFKVTAPDRG